MGGASFGDMDDDTMIERQQIEVVFGLGGGELADPPDPQFPDEWDGVFAYWYEGPPEYCARDYADHWDREYRTAIVYELFGRAATPDGWERVAYFVSSGENDCWCEGDADCPVCEGDGLVYIGDGHCEVVYRRIEDGEGSRE